MCVSGKIDAIFGCLIITTMLGYAAGIKCWGKGTFGDPNSQFEMIECPTGTTGCDTFECDYSPPFIAKGCNTAPADFTEKKCKTQGTCSSAKGEKTNVNKCTLCEGELCNDGGGIKCWAGGKIGDPNFTGYRMVECPPGTIGCVTFECESSSVLFAKGCGATSADYTEDQCKARSICYSDDGIEYPVKKCSMCVGNLCNAVETKTTSTTTTTTVAENGVSKFAPNGHLIIEGLLFVAFALIAIMAI